MKRLKKAGFKRLGGKKRGFTLIELLIVITILAILAAVVILALTGFIGRGRGTGCQMDQKSIQTAAYAYYYESDGGGLGEEDYDDIGWPVEGGTLDADLPTRIEYEAAYYIDTDGDGVYDEGEPVYEFAPNYIDEKPASDTTCGWCIDDDPEGLVCIPNDKLSACPCCTLNSGETAGSEDPDHYTCNVPTCDDDPEEEE